MSLVTTARRTRLSSFYSIICGGTLDCPLGPMVHWVCVAPSGLGGGEHVGVGRGQGRSMRGHGAEWALRMPRSPISTASRDVAPPATRHSFPSVVRALFALRGYEIEQRTHPGFRS